IFAPVLFVGGMLGGIFGQLDRTLLDHASTEIGAFALVGMGAFFAAVIRAPLTSVLIIFEMTRSYELILPLMIANTVAYMFARGAHRLPIYEALLEQDGLRLPQLQRTAATLSSFQVGDVMTTEVVCFTQTECVAEALARIRGLPFTVYPVVFADRCIAGLVSEAKLRRCIADGRSQELLGSLARPEDWLQSEQPLGDAIIRMSALGARQMAVVDGSSRLVGVLAMSDVVRAHARAAQELPRDQARQGAHATPRPAVVWAARDASIPITLDEPTAAAHTRGV
ncbi:MAG TPA: chloride channel protein, partial [Polyangiales bacterium]